jgi:hypothetical protein
MTLSKKRLEGETFAEYKQRMKLTNKILKEYAKGRYKHVSKETIDLITGDKGKTYVKDGKK